MMIRSFRVSRKGGAFSLYASARGPHPLDSLRRPLASAPVLTEPV
jgi:hypothetical protein